MRPSRSGLATTPPRSGPVCARTSRAMVSQPSKVRVVAIDAHRLRTRAHTHAHTHACAHTRTHTHTHVLNFTAGTPQADKAIHTIPMAILYLCVYLSCLSMSRRAELLGAESSVRVKFNHIKHTLLNFGTRAEEAERHPETCWRPPFRLIKTVQCEPQSPVYPFQRRFGV